MKKLINLVAGSIAAALLCVASVSPSHAQASAFVSGGGNNANPCTRTQPCKSIGQALASVGDGAVISCLDEGPYTEAINFSDSFTLDCRGIVFTSGSGFAVTLHTGGVVSFRHVIFDGAAGGGGAVSIQGGGSVVFEDCSFQNFVSSAPQEAVQFAPLVTGAQLAIADSVFASNGTTGSGGAIFVQPAAGITASAVIERTQITGNTYGIVANGFGSGTALVEVRYSSIASNTFDGIWAVTTGTTATVVVEHSSSIRNGGSGANAQGAGAYVSLSDSTVAWNATGLTASGGGLVLSYKNNIIAGNLSPGVTPTGFNLQ